MNFLRLKKGEIEFTSQVWDSGIYCGKYYGSGKLTAGEKRRRKVRSTNKIKNKLGGMHCAFQSFPLTFKGLFFIPKSNLIRRFDFKTC